MPPMILARTAVVGVVLVAVSVMGLLAFQAVGTAYAGGERRAGFLLAVSTGSALVLEREGGGFHAGSIATYGRGYLQCKAVLGLGGLRLGYLCGVKAGV